MPKVLWNWLRTPSCVNICGTDLPLVRIIANCGLINHSAFLIFRTCFKFISPICLRNLFSLLLHILCSIYLSYCSGCQPDQSEVCDCRYWNTKQMPLILRIPIKSISPAPLNIRRTCSITWNHEVLISHVALRKGMGPSIPFNSNYLCYLTII